MPHLPSHYLFILSLLYYTNKYIDIHTFFFCFLYLCQRVDQGIIYWFMRLYWWCGSFATEGVSAVRAVYPIVSIFLYKENRHLSTNILTSLSLFQFFTYPDFSLRESIRVNG